jgi:transposase-like protein
VVNRYRRDFPAAIRCLEEDLEALLAIHRIPVRHHVSVRTTNLVERSSVEERRRTKVIPRLLDKKSAMKLVCATLIRSADRWSTIAVSDLERHQLRLLRQELGIDPPPTRKEDNTTEETIAA